MLMFPNWFYFSVLLLFLLSSCNDRHAITSRLESYLADYQLTLDTITPDTTVFRSFAASYHGASSGVSAFLPFGISTDLSLLYCHRYRGDYIYHATDSSAWIFADVGFPHPCLQPRPMYAQVRLRQPKNHNARVYYRMYYQNCSYGYSSSGATGTSATSVENFFGYSAVHSILLPPGADTVVYIPWRIGSNPRRLDWTEPSADAPRPGFYEFMVYTSEDSADWYLREDWKNGNPFVESANREEIKNRCSYLAPGHFRFIFLEERFDGQNDLTLNRYYIPQHHKEKPLCDSCRGVFPRIHSEHWTADDFYSGRIHRAGFQPAPYGNRFNHVRIAQEGVLLEIPARDASGRSTKTWGEFIFGQAFLYGKVTIRARLAQMLNASGTPNGIIHNIWLFQRDNENPDSSNPYSYLRNHEGVHRYEIDFEFWSSYGDRGLWDDSMLIDYSIVDYMRDPSVALKPSEEKIFGRYTADRKNGKQCNVISPQFHRSFLNDFHVYEIEWRPQFVRFSVDGKETALITPNMARIPNKPMYLWIGSPIYQDGTLFTQSHIPFLTTDKNSCIDYIRIE